MDNGQPMHEAAKVIKELKLPAVWFPHTLMGISTADILEDTTHGAFGPFTGQYFVSDQGHSKIMRMSLEKVNGKYQGACYPFREGFASGLIRLRWGIDGSVFAGMTSRGWSSTGPESFALQRLVWTGKIPFEIETIRAKTDGFEIRFTLPVDKDAARNPQNYEMNGFTYHYHHEYGSEAIQLEPCPLKGIIVSEDGRTVRLVVDNLREGFIHEVKLNSISSQLGLNLLHPVGYYTMNAVPSGDRAVLTDLQKVQHQPHETPAMPVEKKLVSATKSTGVKHQTKMPAGWMQPDQVIVLGTKPGLKYDVVSLQVKAGSKIKWVFNNTDDMIHNVVIVSPGAAREVGDAAFNMGLKGAELNYIPKTNKILFHTNLVQPGSSEAIYFIAPTTPGTYTYLCSFPGHAMLMQGVLNVTK